MLGAERIAQGRQALHNAFASHSRSCAVGVYFARFSEQGLALI